MKKAQGLFRVSPWFKRTLAYNLLVVKIVDYQFLHEPPQVNDEPERPDSKAKQQIDTILNCINDAKVAKIAADFDRLVKESKTETDRK